MCLKFCSVYLTATNISRVVISLFFFGGGGAVKCNTLKCKLLLGEVI